MMRNIQGVKLVDQYSNHVADRHSLMLLLFLYKNLEILKNMNHIKYYKDIAKVNLQKIKTPINNKNVNKIINKLILHINL